MCNSHAVAVAVEGSRRGASAHHLAQQHALAVDLAVRKQRVQRRLHAVDVGDVTSAGGRS